MNLWSLIYRIYRSKHWIWSRCMHQVLPFGFHFIVKPHDFETCRRQRLNWNILFIILSISLDSSIPSKKFRHVNALFIYFSHSHLWITILSPSLCTKEKSFKKLIHSIHIIYILYIAKSWRVVFITTDLLLGHLILTSFAT